MRDDAENALRVHALDAWYGEAHVLHQVSMHLKPGEMVTLLGRNGAGRTTTLRAIMGLLDRREGSIQVQGTETLGLPSHKVARMGLGYCPEERGIFPGLSTLENLMLLPKVGEGGMAAAQIFDMFPNLRERAHSAASRLSGGEQQMLAIARILRTGANILLLDEITEGLAPVIVDRLADVVAQLKERGYTLLLVEQDFAFAAGLADRHYVLESGRVVDEVHRHELSARAPALRRYLSV